MRVVIADAEPISRALLGEALARAGHLTEVAHDGQEAWTLVSGDNPPELLIVDWRVAGLDGLELSRRVRGLGPKAPFVLLLAAADEPEAVAECNAVGADDVLQKPLRLDLLELRLRLAARTQTARLELARMRSEAASRSRVDQLTGVDDRLAITSRFEAELSRAARMQAALTILLLDVDRFRDINDAFGHEAGDTVLVTIAARCRKALRRYDVVGRWGGEEFLLLLPGCTPENAQQLADRLLHAMRSDTIPTSQGRVAITCSLGGICLGAGADESDDPEQVIKAVERAAAEAAAAGGDRATVFRVEAS